MHNIFDQQFLKQKNPQNNKPKEKEKPIAALRLVQEGKLTSDLSSLEARKKTKKGL